MHKLDFNSHIQCHYSWYGIRIVWWIMKYDFGMTNQTCDATEMWLTCKVNVAIFKPVKKKWCDCDNDH